MGTVSLSLKLISKRGLPSPNDFFLPFKVANLFYQTEPRCNVICAGVAERLMRQARDLLSLARRLGSNPSPGDSIIIQLPLLIVSPS